MTEKDLELPDNDWRHDSERISRITGLSTEEAEKLSILPTEEIEQELIKLRDKWLDEREDRLQKETEANDYFDPNSTENSENDMWNRFYTGDIAVYASTREDSHRFLTACSERGIVWGETGKKIKVNKSIYGYLSEEDDTISNVEYAYNDEENGLFASPHSYYTEHDNYWDLTRGFFRKFTKNTGGSREFKSATVEQFFKEIEDESKKATE